VTAWLTAAIIVSVLVLLGCIPLGVDGAYEEGHVSFSVRVWFLSLELGKSKADGEEKPVSPEKAEATAEKQTKKRSLPPWPILKILGKNGYNTLCRLVSRLRVDILKIHFTAAWADPSVTAMAYAGAGVAMEGLLRIGGGRIVHPDMRAMVDFDSQEPMLLFHIRLSLRLYQLLGAAFGFGFGALRDIIRLKIQMKKGKDD
jgi:hypothetical protein